MSMFPIFLVGFVVGIWVTQAYNSYKKETSALNTDTLESIIIQLKEDLTLLDEENKRLTKELDDLKREK